jgi:hypothetical protein
MRDRIPHLYHLADTANLTSILRHGLMSTEQLLQLSPISPPAQAQLLRTHRPDNVRLCESILIRDQRPMPPRALARVLDDGLEPGDWYALLNSFVFLWRDQARMKRYFGAYNSRPQVVLTFDATVLLERLQAHAFVSPINSGNARRRAARRGRMTLIPFATWQREGWPTGERRRPPAEFLFACSIPARSPYLKDITGEQHIEKAQI